MKEDDRTSCPFLVEAPNGGSHWFKDGSLKVISKDGGADLLTPLGDMFEGVALFRFPVRRGSWYAEVEVAKLGKSQPCVGWGLQKEGSPKILRLLAVGGKSAVKIDIGEGAPPQDKKKKEKKADKDKKSGGEAEKTDEAQEEAEKGEEKKEENKDEEQAAETGGETSEKAVKQKEEGDKGKDGREEDEKIKEAKKGEAEAKDEEAEEKKEGEGEEKKEEEGDEKKEEEEEEEEANEDGAWKYGEPFGSAWKEGDVIGILFIAGEAFSLDVTDEESTLALVIAAGDEGELAVNLGQRLFQTAPSPERAAEPASRPGKSSCPKESRSSKGKMPLEDKADVDTIQIGEDNWVLLMEGWVQTRMLVAGTEYEALKPRPPWSPIDPPRKKKERRKRQQTIHATFDTDFCESRNWQFTGNDVGVSQGGPDLLVSSEAASSGVIRWMLKLEDGNDAVEVGVVPVSEVEEPGYLFNTGATGIKSDNVSGGDQKPTWPLHMKYVEVLCDVDRKKVSFKVGSTKDNLQEVKVLELTYDEEVKLAVTGWSGTRVRLEPPQKWMGGEDSDSESDCGGEEDDRFANTCGNVVQPSTWHVATICVDLDKRQEIRVFLDGEPHLVARDPGLFAPEGLFSVDPTEGLVLFGRRRAGKLVEREWRLGGHMRQMRMESHVLTVPEIWGQQLPKGVWGCRTCQSRNAADVRICWSCHTARQKTAVRPASDADPRHEGLTVLVADSFKELVLESKEHVFVLIQAPWCEACQEVKPHWRKLAKMLKGATSIRIAMMDSDENDVPSRFFPESFIPNVKLFLAGKKGKPLACNSRERTFESYLKFLEEHTGVSLESAAEDFYPTYCETMDVPALVQELRQAAMMQNLRLMQWKTPPLQALAAFLYAYLLDPSHYSLVTITPEAIPEDSAQIAAPEQVQISVVPAHGTASSAFAAQLTASLPSSPGGALLARPPPALERVTSHPQSMPGFLRAVSSSSGLPAQPLLLSRAVSTPLEQVADPMKLEEELKRAQLSELLDVRLQAELKKAQPDEIRDFVRDFLLRQSAPKFQHRLFFNARQAVSWKACPAATRLLAAVRIFRRLRRWVRRLAVPGDGALRARAAVSTARGQRRSNWRRVEEAICKEHPREAGVATLQILLERGFNPNASPFGVSPLLLASLTGNLHAAQFLFVRGANLHLSGGVSKQQQLLPIDGAAACGFLRLVGFFRENGSTAARALHFAASGGHVA
ncbi:unnamed protein product [Polarella glacialis]|uniref:Uncharacterized protein n=1 Tax=Polarella glacialis TaxID=89957 RepID=A0A813DRT4_POLGL|nr:unnamed protein product [Polarella glacialis]